MHRKTHLYLLLLWIELQPFLKDAEILRPITMKSNVIWGNWVVWWLVRETCTCEKQKYKPKIKNNKNKNIKFEVIRVGPNSI